MMGARTVRRYGWRPQLPDPRDRRMVVRALALSSWVDLRGLALIPIYDQKQLGSCTANMGAFMFQFCALVEAFSDQAVPSRLFLYYNERVLDGDPSSDSGAQCRDALTCLATQGSIPETEWPYDISKFAETPPDSCYADAKCEKAIQYLAVDQNLAAVKTVLASGFPVGYGFTVYESFESDEVARTGIMPMPDPSESTVGGHANVWVGYFDNSALPAGIPTHESGGYLLSRNSWGESWGAKGYFFMPYAALDKYASDFWVLKLVDGAS